MTETGQNVKYSVSGNKLTIEIDLSKDYGLSKTGKTRVVATTNGFHTLPNGSILSLNLNRKP